MSNKPSHKYKWNDNPMTTKTIEKNVSNCNCSDKGRIKPEKHLHMIGWPEILCNPLYKTTIEQCFIKNMNYIRCEKSPEKNAKKWHNFTLLINSTTSIIYTK